MWMRVVSQVRAMAEGIWGSAPSLLAMVVARRRHLDADDVGARCAAMQERAVAMALASMCAERGNARGALHTRVGYTCVCVAVCVNAAGARRARPRSTRHVRGVRSSSRDVGGTQARLPRHVDACWDANASRRHQQGAACAAATGGGRRPKAI